MSASLKLSVLAFARSHHVLSLATTGAQGPWAAALFYVVDEELSLYFLSDPGTRHCRDIALNARVAATINEAPMAWAAIVGLQIEGRAAAVSPARREAVEALYLARFPEVRRLLSAPFSTDEHRIAQRFAGARFYEIVPRTIRLIDNRLGFGHHQQLDL